MWGNVEERGLRGKGALPEEQLHPQTIPLQHTHTDRHKHIQPTEKQPIPTPMTSHGGSPGPSPRTLQGPAPVHRVGLWQAALSCLRRAPPTWQG